MLEHLPDAIGHALRDARAGMDETAHRKVDLGPGTGAIRVESLAFADHAPIPALYTADGDGRSPPLSWTGVPAAAGQVVLIVEDADAPTPAPLVHAIVVGLDGGGDAGGALREGALTDADADVDDPAFRTGRNSSLGSGWLVPDPPPGHGVHRYVFQVFALEAGADFGDTPGRQELLEAVAAHGLASGLLVGTYERPDGSVRSETPATATAPIAGGPAIAA